MAAEKKKDDEEIKDSKDSKKDKSDAADKDGAEGEGAEGEAAAEGAGDAKKAKRKKLMIIAAILVVVIGLGAGLAIFFTGAMDEPPPPAAEGADGATVSENGEEVAEGNKEALPPGEFVDMPELIVNLAGDSRRAQFLKLELSIEVGKVEDKQRIDALMPRVVDSFQVFLRSLRVEDLQGSANLYRVREELMRRVKLVADPVEVREVLIRGMLVN